MNRKLNWGIISTGRIAQIFASQIQETSCGTSYAVASRNEKKAREFADKYGVNKYYGNYEALIEDPEVDAVYIGTPHPMHAEWAARAAEKGKHILCEKPLTLNYKEAEEVIDCAKMNNVVLMEAFHYRCHPQTRKILELIRNGVIGEVRMIQASFSFNGDFPPTHRILNHDLGGGGILDVGCYVVSICRLLAGAARGQDFADPVKVKACGVIGDQSRVDEYAVASMKFPGDVLANISCGCQLTQENMTHIYGSKGRICVPSPFVVSLKGGTSEIQIRKDGSQEVEKVEVKTDKGLFAIQQEAFCEFVQKGKIDPPAMTNADSLGNMKTLDRWRKEIDMLYDMER